VVRDGGWMADLSMAWRVACCRGDVIYRRGCCRELSWVSLVVVGDAQSALWRRWRVVRRRQLTGGEDEQCRSCFFFPEQ